MANPLSSSLPWSHKRCRDEKEFSEAANYAENEVIISEYGNIKLPSTRPAGRKDGGET